MRVIIQCAADETAVEIRNQFEKIAVETLKTANIEESFEKLEAYHFEIAVCEINDVGDAESIKFLRQKSPKIFIVALPRHGGLLRELCGAEVDDIYSERVEDAIFLIRAKNWIELAAKRANQLSSIAKYSGKNVFSIPVWSRSVKFRIRDEQDIALFWEYFLNDRRFEGSKSTLAWVRACCAIFEELLSDLARLSIVFEENDLHYFVSIRGLPQHIEHYKKALESASLKSGYNIEYDFKKNSGVLSAFKAKEATYSLKFDGASRHERPDFDAIEEKTTYAQDDRVFRLLKLARSGEIFCAKNFLASNDIEDEDIEALADIESQIGVFLDSSAPKLSKLHKLGEFFLRYSSIIEKFMEFNDLTVGVSELADMLINLNTKTSEQTLDRLLFYVFNIKEDLASWRAHIFVFKDAQNIHYLDSSLLSTLISAKSEVDLATREKAYSSELELF